MYIFWIKWKVCVWVLFHRLIKPPVRVKRLLLYKPTCVLMVNVWILFTACLPKRNDQHIYETMYTYYDMISRLYFKALESSSLKQACTRQTSTSVSTHSSPSKFTLEKVSTYKSTSKATKVVCLCYWRTAVRHQLKIQMIQHTTPWSRTGKHKKLGWCQLFLVK